MILIIVEKNCEERLISIIVIFVNFLIYNESIFFRFMQAQWIFHVHLSTLHKIDYYYHVSSREIFKPALTDSLFQEF